MEKERKITAPEGYEIEKMELVDGVAVVTFKKRKEERTIEIFGKKLKIIDSDNDSSAFDCLKCALCGVCTTHIAICETAEHKFNRYFVEIQ